MSQTLLVLRRHSLLLSIHSPYLPTWTMCGKSIKRSGKQVFAECWVGKPPIKAIGNSLRRHTYCSNLGTGAGDYVIQTRHLWEPYLARHNKHVVRSIRILGEETQVTYVPDPFHLRTIKRSYRWAQNSLEQSQEVVVSEEIQYLLDCKLSFFNTVSLKFEKIN